MATTNPHRAITMAARFDEIHTPSVKQQAMAFLSQLPDDVSWEQLAHEFAIAAGVAESIEEDQIADPAQVAALFAKAGVRLAA